MDSTGNIPAPGAAPKSAQVIDAKGKARLQKAVKDFEAIFMGMMMKSMRNTVPKDESSGESFGNDAMESLFDAEVAKKMAGRSNLGLADMLYRSITKEPLNAPDPASPSAGLRKLTVTPALQSDPEDARQGMLEQVPVAPLAQPVHAVRPAQVRPFAAPHPAARRPAAAPPATVSPAVPAATPHGKGWPGAPSASTLERIASYENIIQEAAAKHGVDSTMLKAVIAAESAGNKNAVSPRDAKGLMQLTDSTAADMGVTNVWNPRENIQGGARYLQSLKQRFPGDTTSVIASYNAGPARVEKHGGVPPIPETQAYVRRVMNYMNYFEQEEASHEGR
jgi:soluble lytic murein transglycosylase-like protein